MKKLFIFLMLALSSASLLSMEENDNVQKCLTACKKGDAATVQKLLEDKSVHANISLGDPYVPVMYEGTTFLHWATKYPKVMQLLLEHEANPNAQDLEQLTPLTNAVCGLDTESVAFLLKNGADTKLTDLAGNNPLHEITRIAGSNFLGLSNLTQEEKVKRTCNIIGMLKAKGAPCFLQNRTLETPVHYAAGSNNLVIVSSLLLPCTSEALKTEAHRRFFAFLCTLKRRNSELKLPKDMVFKILSHLPIDCYYGQITHKVLNDGLDRKTFMKRFEKDCKKLVETDLDESDFAALTLTLDTPNMRSKRPYELATDQTVKALLDPKAWQ